jgi:uncharacterized protein YacL
MLRRNLRLALTLAGVIGGAIALWLGEIEPLLGIANGMAGTALVLSAGGLIGGLIGFFLFPLTAWIEGRLARTSFVDILFGAAGLILGLLIAALLGSTIGKIPFLGPVLTVLLGVMFAYLGLTVATRKRDEATATIGIWRGGSDKLVGPMEAVCPPKILDTSVIIDGRIADIVKTGFLEGTLVIPSFVLEELRHIADSSDVLKRNRGRRGLDILNRIQKELSANVRIHEEEVGEGLEVDSKLLRLAKLLKGVIVTNDFNLNKVAELQRVPVLNINELANAVKPAVLPGEEMTVTVIKDGKEVGQGVAYLDDGTMIVVDGGRRHIGETIGVLVTSVLQTSAGRMIFARPKTQVERVAP